VTVQPWRALLPDVIDHALDGVVVCDAEMRYVYANPAACTIMGYQLDELVGRDFLINFPERMHPSMTDAFAAQLDGQVGVFSGTLLLPDGSERDMVWSNMGFTHDGARYGAAIFREAPGTKDSARAVADLAHAAAATAAGEDDVLSTLGALAEAGREHTRATVVGVDLVDPDLVIRRGGRAGAPPGYGEAQTAVSAAGGRIPFIDVWYTGRAVVLSDAPTRLRQDPRFAPLCDCLDQIDWQTAVYIAIAHRGEVLGGLAAYYPSGIPAPTEDELGYLTALADHAAIAVANARLVDANRSMAALEQRATLARELHDSVSQALFSMTMHVRAAQKALERATRGPDVERAVGKAADDLAALSELTTTALAEMRALIFELRPDALERQGLHAALERQGAAISARTDVRVEVSGPGTRLPLTLDAEEHTYRTVLEAVNNAVKHARASAVTVAVADLGDAIEVTVTDDGIGFDPSLTEAGHLGLTAMRERAAAMNATYELSSCPGEGTRVRLTIPITEQPPASGSPRSDAS
jgi:PAS domain S-box-containing protein